MSSIGNIIKGVAGVAGGAILSSAVLAASRRIADRGADAGIDAFVTLAKAAFENNPNQNLVTFTQSARVEPVLLLDSRATYVPFVKDTVLLAQKLFTAFYLQATALDANIGGVRIVQRLDRFNPDRNLANITRTMLSTESYQFGLPRLGESVGLECYGVKNVSLEADVGKQVSDINNLAVGQIVNVDIVEGDKKAVIPVSIRLRVTGMDSDVLVTTLAVGGEDTSARARWRKFDAGEITFFADIIAQRDRLLQHRNAMMKDSSGYYRKVIERANKGIVAWLMGQGPSIGVPSSMIVMTESTRRELEQQISRRLDDYKTRQDIFETTMAMMMFVMDPEWETVTVYIRDIDHVGTYAAGDLKKASEKNDTAEIIKMLLDGRGPGRL